MNNLFQIKDANMYEKYSEDPRIGVYVCHCGGNISDIVDIDRVVKAVSDLPDVSVARRNLFMCSDPGQNMINEDVKSGKINRVVVAACSPSLHELTFRKTLSRSGLNPYLFVVSTSIASLLPNITFIKT